MRERRHDVARSWPRHSVLGRDELKLADSISNSRVCHGFHGKHRLEIGRVGDALEQVDRWKDAPYDPDTRLPVDSG
jgi:hypothetical protein